MRLSKALIVAAAVGALALAGCSSKNQVASLGGKGEGKVEVTQAEAAKDMVECLQEADIEASLDEWDAENVRFNLDTDEPYTMRMRDGSGMMSSGANEAEWEANERRLNELASKYDPDLLETSVVVEGGGAVEMGDVTVPIEDGDEPSEEGSAEPAESDPSASTAPEPEPEPDEPEDAEPTDIPQDSTPYLIIGDHDYTEAFVKCLDETGYTEPEYKTDPKEEVAQKQRQLDSTIEWIKCARDNGYPNMKDPVAAIADDWQTNPMAVLPGDITETALRELLTKCTNFNEADHEAADRETMARYESGDIPNTRAGYAELEAEIAKKYPGYIDPAIGFDYPGYNGDYTNMTGQDEGPDAEAQWERLNKLQEILWEAQEAYSERMRDQWEEAQDTEE
ncbi:MAG: hypothetical protein LBK95_10750 [Bifidobacteriaceae bacterium]|jgi:outer membrane murein-binding lipoprotein Lpp|nr:hypothetical protein [Bifidobacteriaceae bacterium]